MPVTKLSIVPQGDGWINLSDLLKRTLNLYDIAELVEAITMRIRELCETNQFPNAVVLENFSYHMQKKHAIYTGVSHMELRRESAFTALSALFGTMLSLMKTHRTEAFLFQQLCPSVNQFVRLSNSGSELVSIERFQAFVSSWNVEFNRMMQQDRTRMFSAARLGFKNVVVELISESVNPNIPNYQGLLPVDIAAATVRPFLELVYLRDSLQMQYQGALRFGLFYPSHLLQALEASIKIVNFITKKEGVRSQYELESYLQRLPKGIVEPLLQHNYQNSMVVATQSDVPVSSR